MINATQILWKNLRNINAYTIGHIIRKHCCCGSRKFKQVDNPNFFRKYSLGMRTDSIWKNWLTDSLVQLLNRWCHQAVFFAADLLCLTPSVYHQSEGCLFSIKWPNISTIREAMVILGMYGISRSLIKFEFWRHSFKVVLLDVFLWNFVMDIRVTLIPTIQVLKH